MTIHHLEHVNWTGTACRRHKTTEKRQTYCGCGLNRMSNLTESCSDNDKASSIELLSSLSKHPNQDQAPTNDYMFAVDLEQRRNRLRPGVTSFCGCQCHPRLSLSYVRSLRLCELSAGLLTTEVGAVSHDRKQGNQWKHFSSIIAVVSQRSSGL